MIGPLSAVEWNHKIRQQLDLFSCSWNFPVLQNDECGHHGLVVVHGVQIDFPVQAANEIFWTAAGVPFVRVYPFSCTPWVPKHKLQVNILSTASHM